MDYSINIVHLYPELLNLYGDKGNIAALSKRLSWRGIDVNITEYELDDEINFENTDIVFLGGGSDKEQLMVCNRLREYKEKIKEYTDNDGVLIAVCGGYQMLGKYYKLNGEAIEGLNILDIYSESAEKRFIGNVKLESNICGEKMTVAGFENHSGKTYIGDYKPFGTVIHGNGNNGEDKTCGIFYKNILGTYLHGPLLPKNPKLCDFLLSLAIKKKYGESISLSDLDDSLENEAHDYAMMLD